MSLIADTMMYSVTMKRCLESRHVRPVFTITQGLIYRIVQGNTVWPFL